MPSLPDENVRLLTGLEPKWSWPQSLEEFGTQLCRLMDLPDFDYDGENVYEWGQTLTLNDLVEVNISRKHGGFHPPPGPISVIFQVSKDAPIEWDAEWIAEHLLPQFTQAVVEITGTASA